MALELKDINYHVDNQMYLQDINLRFEAGSFNVLLGRTLAGKTSLMRVISGLDKPTSGSIKLHGNDVTTTSVQKRNISMVYQQFINYPNMTVAENIASPLSLAGVAKAEIKTRVQETAALLQIEDFLERYPLELSGGQQQRCAMARALVKDADIILFDEPLVNLDYKLRESLRSELKSLFQARNCIAIYATTEAHEALALGGTTTLLHEGRVLQSGAATEQYMRPVNLDAADLYHEPPLNTFSGNKTTEQLHFHDHSIEMPNAKQFASLVNGDYQFGIRADHIRVVSKDNQRESGQIIVNGIVDLAEIGAAETYLHVNVEQLNWVVVIRGVHPMHTQTPVQLAFDLDDLFVFDTNGNALAWPNKNRQT